MSDRCDTSRRRFIKLSAIGIAVTPLVGRVSLAADRLEEDDPVAQAMQYTHVSQTEGQNCQNCVLFTETEGEDWGACQIFPGKLVSREGWCAAWVLRS